MIQQHQTAITIKREVARIFETFNIGTAKCLFLFLFMLVFLFLFYQCLYAIFFRFRIFSSFFSHSSNVYCGTNNNNNSFFPFIFFALSISLTLYLFACFSCLLNIFQINRNHFVRIVFAHLYVHITSQYMNACDGFPSVKSRAHHRQAMCSSCHSRIDLVLHLPQFPPSLLCRNMLRCVLCFLFIFTTINSIHI